MSAAVRARTASSRALLAQAETAYNDAQTALKAGNLAEYQKQVDKMADLIRQAGQASGGPTSTNGAASTTTTTRK